MACEPVSKQEATFITRSSSVVAFSSRDTGSQYRWGPKEWTDRQTDNAAYRAAKNVENVDFPHSFIRSFLTTLCRVTSSSTGIPVRCPRRKAGSKRLQIRPEECERCRGRECPNPSPKVTPTSSHGSKRDESGTDDAKSRTQNPLTRSTGRAGIE